MIMSSVKRNRNKIKSGTPSPTENKRPNMAAQTSDLVDITEFNMGSVGNEDVLYEVLMKMCEGINAINKDTKVIKKSVDKGG